MSGPSPGAHTTSGFQRLAPGRWEERVLGYPGRVRFQEWVEPWLTRLVNGCKTPRGLGTCVEIEFHDCSGPRDKELFTQK